MKLRLISLFVILLEITAHAVSAAPAKSTQSPRSTERASSINILSIIPAQGEPGTSVTLYGSGFTDKTIVILGNQELATTVLGPKQLSFDIPKLSAGLYALFLKKEDGATSKVYSFTLLPQKPVVTGLTPDVVESCSSGRDREVTVSGQNFQEKSQLVFDGAAIRSRFVSETSLSFVVPQVVAGLHQVQVKNAEDAFSGTLGLMISAKPEIENISQGETYVNYYNLIIEGKNFQQGSVVVVMEDSSVEQAGGQYSVDTRRIAGGSYGGTQREKIIYGNCNRIIYQRYPYSTVLKSFRVQVVNPNGEESSIMPVSAP